MVNSFDIASINYDATFTHSNIGILQRNYVYEHFKKTLSTTPSIKNILEINCGTGEDAIWLTKQGYNVLATDISEKMVETASKKETNLEGSLKFEQADINKLNSQYKNKKFDLVFSNFGGLNCLDENNLKGFLKNIPELLSKNGKVVMVIMPRKCIWERIYFILKGNFKKAFRRNSKEASIADVDGEKVPTWYYNPKDIINLLNQNFIVEMKKPIGFFVPPSYLEPFFKKNKKLLSFFNYMDNKIKHFGFLSSYSDHYLISIKLK